MYFYVLTGGIGSGKSTVAELLVRRGAARIDADRIVAELQQPHTDVFAAIVEAFGATIVQPDGTLDRRALADIVFADPQRRARLEAIVHPAARQEIQRQVAEFRTLPASTQPPALVAEIPLVSNGGGYDNDGLIVVDCPLDTVIERLITDRAMTKTDATNRIEVQLGRDERNAMADYVVVNDASLAELEAKVDHCWNWMMGR